MVLVYTAESLAIVQNVMNALEANGIPCVIRNDILNAGAGQLAPLGCGPEVWGVDDPDAERAEQFIDAALHLVADLDRGAMRRVVRPLDSRGRRGVLRAGDREPYVRLLGLGFGPRRVEEPDVGRDRPGELLDHGARGVLGGARVAGNGDLRDETSRRLRPYARSRTSALILWMCPRPRPFTSQPSSKNFRILSSSRMPKQSTIATGPPAIFTTSSGVSFK